MHIIGLSLVVNDLYARREVWKLTHSQLLFVVVVINVCVTDSGELSITYADINTFTRTHTYTHIHTQANTHMHIHAVMTTMHTSGVTNNGSIFTSYRTCRQPRIIRVKARINNNRCETQKKQKSIFAHQASGVLRG